MSSLIFPSIEWTRLLWSSSGVWATATTTSGDGSVYVAGYTDSNLKGNNANGGQDVFLTRYSPSGDELWTKVFGTNADDIPSALATSTDGSVYLVGYTRGSLDGQINRGDYDAFIVKFDPQGTRQWTKTAGTNSYDLIQSISIGEDGSLYVAGETGGNLDDETSFGSDDAFVSKYDSKGTRLWTKLLGTPVSDKAYALKALPDGSLYVVGYSEGRLNGQTNNGDYDAFLARYSTDGKLLWVKQFGTKFIDIASSITSDKDGSVYVSGRTMPPEAEPSLPITYRDAFLGKFSSDGAQLWNLQLSPLYLYDKTSISTAIDGSIYVVGGSNHSSTVATDIFMTKVTSSGEKLWNIEIGTNSFDLANAITVSSDGSIVISGVTSGRILDGQTNGGTYSTFTSKWQVQDQSSNALPTVQFSSTSSAVVEGNNGNATVTLQATLSARSTQAVTVPVTYSGTATSGTDYGSATTSITIAAGQTTGSASFSVIGDTTLESNETVILTMGTPTNAMLGAIKSYTHTIINDDLNAGPKGLGGVAYHWKSHALLSGVTVSTGDQKAVQADSDLFDLRAASFDAASGTLTVQLWVNPVQASMSFDVSAVTQGAKSASFTPSLSASTWTVLANTDKPNDVSISGFSSNPSAAGVTGALQLGTLTMVLTPNAPVAVNFKNLSVGNSTSADVNLTLASASTDASGVFALALPDGSYGLTVSRAVGDGSNNNGVTSADALAALKIAVGMNPNTDPDGSGPLQTPMLSPYQVMAADVNGDGRVTSADALAILKMSVKLADAPAPAWMFVEEDRDFWDEATKAFTLTRSNAAWDAQIKVSMPADAKTNLVGVLKGDVNGSWTLAGASTLEATNPTYFKDLAQLIGVPADQWGIPPGG